MMTSLGQVPDEVAALIGSFLDLDDLITLCGTAAGDAATLSQFMPVERVLDVHVLGSALCLRSEKRKRHRDGDRQVQECRRLPATCTSHDERQLCPYHNISLRRLILQHRLYTRLISRKVDATEALQHLTDGEGREVVAVEILHWQQHRRRLNHVSLVRALVYALCHACHKVVNWILCRPSMSTVPKRCKMELLEAICNYTPSADSDGLLKILKQCWATQEASTVILIAASKNGRLDLVRRVLEQDVSPSTGVLSRALCAASASGHTEAVQLLLAMGCSKQAVSFSTIPALHEASSRSQREVVELLVRCSTSVHASVLHTAVVGEDAQILSWILGDERFNQWDPLALHQAAKNSSVTMVDSLLHHGGCRRCDVEAAVRSAVRCVPRIKSEEHTQVIRLLVRWLTRESPSSWELVDQLCAFGDLVSVNEAIAKLPSDSWSDRRHWRPVVSAARHGHASIVKLLVTCVDAMKDSPSQPLLLPQDDTELAEALLAACHSAHLEAAELLMPLVSLDWIRLLRIVEAAAAAPSSSVLQWLLDTQQTVVAECDVDAALQYACANGRVAAASILLAHPRISFSDGVPIQFAATSGCIELVELLLQDNRVTHRFNLETALVDAAREGHAAVATRLLADPRLHITSGAAIHEAVYHGRIDVLKQLLHSDSVWLQPNVLQLEEAYEIAVRRGHYRIVFELLTDERVMLPHDGVVTTVYELPKRPGDAAWWRFLRRFFRHHRIKPSEQVLWDACRLGREDVLDSLLRSGRMTVSEQLLADVDGLAQQSIHARNRLTRRFARMACRLREYNSYNPSVKA